MDIQPQIQCKLLIIDDDNLIRLTIKSYFEDYGFDILDCPDGKAGIECIKKYTPDLVVTDIHMPHLNGLQVLKWIQKNCNQLPVIVLSATTDIENAVEALRLGAWDFIIKPIPNMSILSNSIVKALERAMLIKEISEYQLRLEEKVNESTQKLLIANKQLRNTLARLEEQNIQLEEANQKSEESNRLKTAFLSNLSHEIRTPMNGIMGFINLLKSSLLTNNEKEEFIDQLFNSSKRILSLMDNLVDISLIETNQLKTKIKEFDVNQVINNCYLIIKDVAKSKGVNVNTNCELSENESCILLDGILIEKVLLLLLDNAIKFTFKGEISFGYKVKKEEIEFFVKDTGIGIGQDSKVDIFQPFRQVDEGSLERGFEGAGLGLAISKSIVEKLGGKIGYDSLIDVGTRFYFTIPYVPILNENLSYS